MVELLLHWIAKHGYGVIFAVFALGIFGLPLPNDLILAYLGFLIYKGQLHAMPTVVAAFFGAVGGMMINYVLGRTFGHYLVARFGAVVNLTQEKVQWVHDWFERSGRWGLVVGYFLPGVRHLTAFAAGTSRMPFWEFALFGSIGGLLWSGAFITLGFFLEEHWSRETERIHHILEIGSVAVIALALGYLLMKKFRGRREG
jgi:membrane protein DedA with SNARE-associated domain